MNNQLFKELNIMERCMLSEHMYAPDEKSLNQ